MSKKEKIIDRIKKLFALAGNNPSTQEAKAAALKAQELIAEYDVKQSELLEDVEEIIESSCYVGKGNKWKYLLANAIAKNFRCKCFSSNNEKFVFCGHATDSAVAKETFEFLFNQNVKLSRAQAYKARKKNGTAYGVARSFSLGFVSGVKEVLDRQSTALMLVVPEDVEEEFKVRTKGFTTTKRRYSYSNASSYDNGVYAGRCAMSRGIAGA